MECNELQDSIESLALSAHDELPREVLVHLDGCEACRALFQKTQDAWCLVSAALPTTTPNQQLEKRLFERIAKAPAPEPQYSRAANIGKYAIAATVLFALVGVTWLSGFLGIGKSQADLAQIRAIANQLERLDELERKFANSSLKYVSLSSGSEQDLRVFLVHDAFSEQVHVFVDRLSKQDSRNIHVWLLDANDNILSSDRLERGDNPKVGAAMLIRDEFSGQESLLFTVEEENSIPTSPSQDTLFRQVVGEL